MTARFVRIVATNGLAYPCTPGSPFPDVPTAGAVSSTSPAVPATFSTPQGNAAEVAVSGKAQWSQCVCSVRTAEAEPDDARIIPSPGCQNSFADDPEDFIEQGYGTGPRCIQCRRNVSACHCDDEDIDVPHVEDMKRIMPRLFGRIADGSSWLRAEQAALNRGARND